MDRMDRDPNTSMNLSTRMFSNAPIFSMFDKQRHARKCLATGSAAVLLDFFVGLQVGSEIRAIRKRPVAVFTRKETRIMDQLDMNPQTILLVRVEPALVTLKCLLIVFNME